ncbi:MAG: aspartate racemase [Arenicella sp.]
MNTIGLIGGMSWESTLSYYQAINLGVKDRLGGLHSAKLVMVSVDFAEIEKMQHLGDWLATAGILIEAARSLEAAGADGFIICTNTMHKVADQVAAEVSIPLLHIADATANVLKRDGLSKVGLLGTSFTMEQEFYKGRLAENGFDVLVPNQEQRGLIHSVIYQQLCVGNIRLESKQAYLEIVQDLAERGAQAVILGCTEIGLLIQQSDTDIALYDTTKIHADAAVEFVLGPKPTL